MPRPYIRRQRRGSKIPVIPPEVVARLFDRELPAEMNCVHKFFLENPRKIGDPALFCGRTLFEIWQQQREDVLEHWIAENPGSRPSLWWEWDAPEPRRHLESEASYLLRHKLLTVAEKRRLPRDAFAPTLL